MSPANPFKLGPAIGFKNRDTCLHEGHVVVTGSQKAKVDQFERSSP
jgi:hypothetical protein